MKYTKNDFYVITGGPGVGKTTLIESLKSHRFRTVEEDARKIIKHQMHHKANGLPWKDKKLYAKLMFEASLNRYEEVSAKEYATPIFFDRGLIDAICYMKMEKIDLTEQIMQKARLCTYNERVFLLPPWKEIYTTDEQRKQHWDEAESTFEIMKETYIEYDYAVVEVPKASIEERIQFICRVIEAE